VINATGVILHTNLGRAPLAESVREAMARAGAGYSNLEYDLSRGERGSRYDHCVRLVTELTGSEDALVVNNNAAAVTLALNTLALGGQVLVSRGELVEIGGGFRIPEILSRAGAGLREVGTTNRTRLEDYREALEEEGADVILKVHRSNFRISGFTEEAGLEALSELARERGIPLVHDLGSGMLVEAEAVGLPPEPRPRDSLAHGADVVAFSGDKLMGGPQAGILAGSGELISAMRRNSLCRALRVDKVTLAGIEATLLLYRDPARAVTEVPALRMLGEVAEDVKARATRVAEALESVPLECRVVESSAVVGGGTYPEVELESWAVRITSEADAASAPTASPPTASAATASELARLLREGDPPVIARVEDDALLLDLRTVTPGEEEDLVRRVREAADLA
jgi:L-seryl-tRNA(Ser) seleniumtransferase